MNWSGEHPAKVDKRYTYTFDDYKQVGMRQLRQDMSDHLLAIKQS